MVDKFKVTTPMIHSPDAGEGGLLNLFDQTNPDINFFNMIDDEIIKLSGSRFLLFKYLGIGDLDNTYMEDKDKLVSKEPIEIVGHYDPKVVEQNMSEFGIEITNDQLFTFNKSYVQAKLGRIIVPGDIIKPRFQNIKYKIFEVQEDSFEAYGVYHLVCSGKVLRDTEDVIDIPRPDTSDSKVMYGRK